MILIIGIMMVENIYNMIKSVNYAIIVIIIVIYLYSYFIININLLPFIKKLY